MNREEYKKLYNKGERFNTVGFFLGENSKEFGPKMLSNFYPSPFVVKLKDEEELNFTCSEQMFMWIKAKTFKSEEIASEIAAAPYAPKRYKALGRKVIGYDDKIWSERRVRAMYNSIKYKFKTNSRLKEYLLSTGDAILIEANPRDKIWACGMSINSDYSNPNHWTGDNLLGFLLMDLRDELRKELT